MSGVRGARSSVAVSLSGVEISATRGVAETLVCDFSVDEKDTVEDGEARIAGFGNDWSSMSEASDDEKHDLNILLRNAMMS